EQADPSAPSEIVAATAAVEEAPEIPDEAGPEVSEEKSETKPEAAAFASAAERRERTGRGRIFGKAAVPADGPQGLEITVALHRVPESTAADFTYDDTLVTTTAAAAGTGTYEFKNLAFGVYVLFA